MRDSGIRARLPACLQPAQALRATQRAPRARQLQAGGAPDAGTAASPATRRIRWCGTRRTTRVQPGPPWGGANAARGSFRLQLALRVRLFTPGGSRTAPAGGKRRGHDGEIPRRRTATASYELMIGASSVLDWPQHTISHAASPHCAIRCPIQLSLAPDRHDTACARRCGRRPDRRPTGPGRSRRRRPSSSRRRRLQCRRHVPPSTVAWCEAWSGGTCTSLSGGPPCPTSW
jgi:hypothetical protein